MMEYSKENLVMVDVCAGTVQVLRMNVIILLILEVTALNNN